MMKTIFMCFFPQLFFHTLIFAQGAPEIGYEMMSKAKITKGDSATKSKTFSDQLTIFQKYFLSHAIVFRRTKSIYVVKCRIWVKR